MTRRILSNALAAMALTAAAFGAQAQTVQLIPSATEVKVGDTFTVDIQGLGFPDKIFGGGYDLAYSTGLLDLVSISIPGIWEFAVSEGTQDEAAGTVKDVFFNTFSNPRAGDFLTATLTFKATGTGAASIDALPSAFFPFGNEFAEAVDVTYLGTSVQVVPEPGTWALVLGGLAVAGALRRRRAG